MGRQDPHAWNPHSPLGVGTVSGYALDCPVQAPSTQSSARPVPSRAWTGLRPRRSGLLLAILAVLGAPVGLAVSGCDRWGLGGSGDGPASSAASGADSASGGSPAPEAETGGGPSDAPAPVVRPRVEPPPPEPEPPSPEEAGDCPKRRDPSVGVIVNPRRTWAGQPVTVMFATLEGEEALAVSVTDSDGKAVEVDAVHRRGVPASTRVTFVPDGEADPYVVTVGRKGKGMRCVKVAAPVGAPAPAPPGDPNLDHVWSLRRSWGPAEEALFSAWVRELFWAPVGEELAFDQLTRVTADPKRNVLFGHMGWGEDDPKAGLRLVPDCADTPYFLRAYFAWKRGLPFGFRRCSRGTDGPPTCFDLQTNLAPPELAEEWKSHPPEAEASPSETGTGTGGAAEMVPGEPFDALMVLDRFFRRTVAWGVHSGNGRCPYAADDSDFYPLALTRKSLRPGTTYADPYGHLFVLVELVGQRGKRPGILYAVDGQPDGSITRKRFWEGNFLWNPDPALGGSGFKAFRPIDLVNVPDPETGAQVPTVVAATNDEIARRTGYANVDTDLASLDADAFYDRMDRLISPAPLDPFLAQDAAITALAEAAQVRVTSVANGLEWAKKHPDELVEMPWGHDVFETSGAWENYSTPARDLRLLIAMDLVANFDEKVARQPAAYGLSSGPELERTRAALEAERARMLADPKFSITYESSSGESRRLTLADLFERVERLEVAYNPNDCVEVRWGAQPGSKEMQGCRVRAPEDQRKKMEAYRVWFAERKRPARGDPGPPVPGLPAPGVAPADP